MRKTKIIATIGPASEPVEMLQALMQAGINVCRLNFSHGDFEEQGRRIIRIKEVREKLGLNIAIMQDLKGPEMRIGLFEGNGKIMLEEGQTFTLTTQECLGNQERVYVQYPDLVTLKPGDRPLLDDGNITLEVIEVVGADVRCRVIVGGKLSNRKKVNLPGHHVNLPFLAEKDVADLRWGVEQGIDMVAASFVQTAADVLAIRRVLEEAGKRDSFIIAKIENQAGLDHLDEILEVSDGLMVARGDLGVEVPAEEVPVWQKRMIKKCNEMGKPVVTATQMLESMIEKPRPTRAEASDVANAIFDGTDCIMLSAESAAGSFPVEAVKTMDRIARRTEQELNHRQILAGKAADRLHTVTDAISHAVVTTATDLEAAAILTATRSGYTARMISKYRPEAPIAAVTQDGSVARQLAVSFGVYPVLATEASSTDEMFDISVKAAQDAGIVKDGDLVVITAGVPVGVQGGTNLMKVQTVGEVLAQGTGIGRQSVTGRAIVVKGLQDLERVQPGDILVTQATDKEFVPAMERAAAIVTEEGGYTSHAAVVGISLGKPVIVGAAGAQARVTDGQLITVDGPHGLVYRGRAQVR